MKRELMSYDKESQTEHRARNGAVLNWIDSILVGNFGKNRFTALREYMAAGEPLEVGFYLDSD